MTRMTNGNGKPPTQIAIGFHPHTPFKTVLDTVVTNIHGRKLVQDVSKVHPYSNVSIIFKCDEGHVHAVQVGWEGAKPICFFDNPEAAVAPEAVIDGIAGT